MTTIRGFKAVMSSGANVKLDDSELDNLLAAVQAGTFVKLKQGVVNTRHLVSVIPDEERDIYNEAKELARGYDDGGQRYEIAVRKGLRPLSDCFDLSKRLEASRQEEN